MTYSETFFLPENTPIHTYNLGPLREYGFSTKVGLRLDGFNIDDPAQFDALETLPGRGRGQEHTITIETSDPRTLKFVRDVTIQTLLNGRRLPDETIAAIKQNIRDTVQAPEEAPVATPVKPADPAAVSSDMTNVTSNWQVVALGELQQPSGVGAAQGDAYNPVTDGPNRDGPDFANNAGNSPEQEEAFQTWVNTAVDSLNKGESPEAIVAQLAHDGCPNPEEILQRAQEQPTHTPVDDRIGQDPFEAPMAPDPMQSGEMQGTSQQPSTLAGTRVRIAGTSQTGSVVDSWESMWGEKTVHVALDGGGDVSVAPEALQSVTEGAKEHPVTEIQQFMDNLPEVKPSRPYIEAHIANMGVIRQAVRSNISKVGFSDKVKLQSMDRQAADQEEACRQILASTVEDFDVAYVKALPKFRINAFDVATPEVTPWEGRAREAGAIWATENFSSPVTDRTEYLSAAAHFASSVGMTGQQFDAFVAGADEHRHVTTEEFSTEEPTTDNEGPAEALFI